MNRHFALPETGGGGGSLVPCQCSCRRSQGFVGREFKMNVDHEVQLLKEEIKRLGKPAGDGKYEVTFGALFNDDKCANIFEALVGTLRAAKRKKVISYDGELLLQGVHDNVVITLLQE